jgi:two-component system, cell cycle sensor histidine kinase and response regulator CckA
VDPALFEQALINLVINARDAMPNGGTVTLSIRNVERQHAPWVEIEVADEGVGMAPELVSRVFEPFFTTKGDRGTGLGLPTVVGTIEQHGGVVEVDTELGRGSRFRVRVPASQLGKPESLAPPIVRVMPGESSREILVVEDEPLVAAVIARTLERRGHRPLLAHRPSEALRLWAAHPSVSLVISDVSMAEMRGPELVDVLRQSGREFRVVYVTGYQDDDSFDAGGEPVLSKPFSPRDLMRAVAETRV